VNAQGDQWDYIINTYVRHEDGGGTPFYKMVEEKEDEWDKVTNLAMLPENVPSVILQGQCQLGLKTRCVLDRSPT